MSLGKGYYLYVKHATTNEWKQVGPLPSHWGMFHETYPDSVEEMENMFKSLGLETKIEEIQVEYDTR
jgi:hypothetical protein